MRPGYGSGPGCSTGHHQVVRPPTCARTIGAPHDGQKPRRLQADRLEVAWHARGQEQPQRLCETAHVAALPGVPGLLEQRRGRGRELQLVAEREGERIHHGASIDSLQK